MTARGRRLAGRLAIGGLVAVVALAYLWPALTRDSDRVEVVLVGDGQLAESAFQLGRRIRERGPSVDDQLLGSDDACGRLDALGDLEDEVHPEVVVASFRGSDCLAELVDAARAAHVLLVVQPGPGGQDPGALAELQDLEGADRVTIVDPSRLLPPDGTERVPCEWWDDCGPDGLVAVREAAGSSLTDAGQERVARAVAGAIP